MGALLDAAKAARDFIAESNNETGYCMCGSAVKDHGMGDGHSPVDEGVYTAMLVVEALDDALRP